MFSILAISSQFCTTSSHGAPVFPEKLMPWDTRRDNRISLRQGRTLHSLQGGGWGKEWEPRPEKAFAVLRRVITEYLNV